MSASLPPNCKTESIAFRVPAMSSTPIIINLANQPYEDSEGLLWVHGLSRARIEYEGKPYPFDDELIFGEVFEGLSAQINQGHHQPNYQVDEDMAGHGRGRRTSIAGVIRQVRRVSQQDLADQDVHIDEPEAIMFGVDLTPYGRELMEQGQLRFSSLGLSIIRSDERLDPETNEPLINWSAFLREMSGCGQPHIKSLRPIDETNHLSLAESPTPKLDEMPDTYTLSDEQLEMIANMVFDKLSEMNAAEPVPSADMAEIAQMIADEGGDRAEVIARLASAAGVEVGAVEAILAGSVDATPEQIAAMKTVLSPSTVEAGSYDKMAMAELEVVKADNKAIRADLSAYRDEQKRKETRQAILDRARVDKVRVDFSEEENAGMFDLMCSQYEDAPDTFDQLWSRLSRDERDGSGRIARNPKRVADDVAFSVSPSSPEQVQANKSLIAKYRAEHKCSASEAMAALRSGRR